MQRATTTTRRQRGAARLAVATVAAIAACVPACSSGSTDATGPSATGSSGTDASSQAGTPVADDTEVVVALLLSVDTAGLASLAHDTSDPSSAQYRQFASIADIASAHGASSDVIEQNRSALADLGLDLDIDPTHGAFWGTVTAQQVEDNFGTTLVQNGGIIQPSGTPSVPSGLTGIAGVVGLTGTAPTGTSSGDGASSGSNPTTAPCPSTWPTQASLAQRFGFDNALSAGQNGAGTTVAIVGTAPFEPAVFSTYAACAGTSVSTANVAQHQVPAAPEVPGNSEVALDTLVITLLAPQAQLDVAQYDDATSLAFPLLQLLGAASTTPNVLDLTMVYCEGDVATADLALSEWLLAAYAATGTTTVAAAGDTGSSGCAPNDESAHVTYPASSAFVSAVGGAQYDGDASAPGSLTTWNVAGVEGGGGGTSGTVDAPPWQTQAKRQVPDASVYAVPGGVGSVPVCASAQSCTWQNLGGTSLAATVIGAAGVLSAQQHATDGTPARWGNIAAMVWRRGSDASAITDITSGANTTFTDSCCTAADGYDTATGWGLFDPDAVTWTP